MAIVDVLLTESPFELLFEPLLDPWVARQASLVSLRRAIDSVGSVV